MSSPYPEIRAFAVSLLAGAVASAFIVGMVGAGVADDDLVAEIEGDVDIDIAVDGDDGVTESQVNVRSADRMTETGGPTTSPLFEVSTALHTERIEPGEQAVVNVVIANTGSGDGMYTITLARDHGQVTDSRTVAVDAGDERSVTLHDRIREPGNYTLSVDGDMVGTVVVADLPDDAVTPAGASAPADATDPTPTETEPPAKTADAATPTADPTSDQATPAGAVWVIGLLLGILLFVVFAVRRLRDEESPSSAESEPPSDRN